MTIRILEALRGQRTPTLPVWFMRQAGRSLPEYQQARKDIKMLDSCLMPELAAEITLQPVRRHNVDAAIFFSDIMVPLRLAGVDVDIAPGVGPVLGSPIRSRQDVKNLPTPTFDDAGMIAEAIRLIRAELPTDKTLLGFAGAPFTLAAYMVEGRPSKDHLRARALMYSDPTTWNTLLSWCATVSNLFLRVQIEAGAQGVQLFDSWAGSLSRTAYETYVLPYSRRTLEEITVPRIHFGTYTNQFLDLMAHGFEAVGVDHRTPLDEAARLVPDTVLQGNIDPALLFAGQDALHAHALDVVRRGLAAPAHIVNLGHGVPPTTDPGVLTELVAFLHDIEIDKLTEEE
ncbi:MAG: uroporphyrinogen decarboxylase [Actinomycetaceae bacterium]|nr:uroporphyrinogen decarboxylase [Actinomycetaceae bacterium]